MAGQWSALFRTALFLSFAYSILLLIFLFTWSSFRYLVVLRSAADRILKANLDFNNSFHACRALFVGPSLLRFYSNLRVPNRTNRTVALFGMHARWNLARGCFERYQNRSDHTSRQRRVVRSARIAFHQGTAFSWLRTDLSDNMSTLDFSDHGSRHERQKDTRFSH